MFAVSALGVLLSFFEPPSCFQNKSQELRLNALQLLGSASLFLPISVSVSVSVSVRSPYRYGPKIKRIED